MGQSPSSDKSQELDLGYKVLVQDLTGTLLAWAVTTCLPVVITYDTKEDCS